MAKTISSTNLAFFTLFNKCIMLGIFLIFFSTFPGNLKEFILACIIAILRLSTLVIANIFLKVMLLKQVPHLI